MSYTMYLGCIARVKFNLLVCMYGYLAAHEVLSELRLDFSRKFLLAQVEVEVVHRLE